MTAFNKAWIFLKALPEQQLFSTDEYLHGHREEISPDVYGLGTVHPAALAMARREQAESPPGSVQIQRLNEPDYGIQERTGSPEPMPHEKSNVKDIKRYGGVVTNLGGYKTSPQGTRVIDEKHPNFRVKPSYPPRDPIYFDTPLNLEGGH